MAYRDLASELGLIPRFESGNRDYYSDRRPVVSPKGAMYAMQVMPSTAHDPGYGVRPALNDTPEEYNRVGVDYANAMLNRYGDPRLAAGAYNGGPGRLDNRLGMTGGDPSQALGLMPAETQGYVNNVAPNGGMLAKPIAGQRPLPTSDVPGQNLGMEILKTYVQNKQQQSQRGSFVQDILSKRFEPTQDDIAQANLQNTQAALLPESYKTTTPGAIATDRLSLELAPYTTLAKLKELNQPYSEAGKLMYDVQEGLVSPEIAQATMDKNTVDLDLKRAQTQAAMALARQRSTGGGQKAPAGYRYNADGTTLEAIPGGPATKLPGNEAAQLALLNTSLQNMPKIRDIFGKNFNGVVNGTDFAIGRGNVGNAKRLVTAGIEAALRAMSGAAVPKEEVERYSELYLPTPLDTFETRMNKLNELEKFMRNASTNMGKGRTESDMQILQGNSGEDDPNRELTPEELQEYNSLIGGQ